MLFANKEIKNLYQSQIDLIDIIKQVNYSSIKTNEVVVKSILELVDIISRLEKRITELEGKYNAT